MTGPLRVTSAIVIPAGELRWRFSRAGGPGGQSVNTADSRVELSWSPATSAALPAALRDRALDRLAGRLTDDGTLTVTAAEHRAQLDNRRAALDRLAVLIRDAIAPPPKARRPRRPSQRAAARRLTAKRHRGDVKRLRRNTDDT
jgi:ribosome-associated protein